MYTAPKFCVPNHSISAKELAKVLYCPKATNPRQQKCCTAPKNNNLLEPVRAPGERRPQRLGQSSIFASFAKRDLDITATLYCPKTFVAGDEKLWDSTALLLKNHQESMRPQLLVSPKTIGTVQHFCWLSCKNVILSQSLGLGQYSTFAGFPAKTLYCPNRFCQN